MQRVWLLAIFVLAVPCARGQQASAPSTGSSAAAAAAAARPAETASAAAKAASGTAVQPETVKVYEPRKPVKPPRLLPPAKALDVPSHCTDTSEGQSELSLLIDTQGRPRNIMFLKPSGSMADRFAVTIAEGDRFAPAMLNGKPVVVAESLSVRMKACIAKLEDAKGKSFSTWVLKEPAHQKLRKPKDPPQVAVLAPVETPLNEVKLEELTKTVKRPDFFGNGESAPVLLRYDYPPYTPSERWARIKGTCEIALTVDAHGLPQNVHVLKGLDPGLDRSAVETVENYRYFPAIRNNEPVPAGIVVSLEFAPPSY